MVGGSVPHQRVADVVLVDGVEVVVDCQMQRCGAVAARGVGAVVGGRGGGSGIEVPVPAQRVAGGSLINATGIVIDGQMQGVDLYAMVCVGMAMGVASAEGVGRPVPGEGLAGCVVDGCVYRLQHGEGHHHGAVGVGCCLQYHLLCAFRQKLHAVPFIGQLMFADGAFVVANDGLTETVDVDGYGAGVAAGAVAEHGHQLHLMGSLRQGVVRIDVGRGGAVVENPEIRLAGIVGELVVFQIPGDDAVVVESYLYRTVDGVDKRVVESAERVTAARNGSQHR